MTQLDNKIQHPSSSQYQSWLEKITFLAKCTQSILTELPTITYSDFYYQALQSTAVNTIADMENVLRQQLTQHLQELLNLSPYKKSTLQLQHIIEVYQHSQENTIDKKLFRVPRVAIVGAGLAGLYAAYALAKHGIFADIFESRSNEEARLRPQNISFKEAENCIKPMLAKKHYDEFFKRGGAMDGKSGKLRITTGSFQDILTEALLEQGINIQYNYPIYDIDSLAGKNYTSILIAAGVHSCERLQLNQHFQPLHFSQYTARGRTALCIAPSNEQHGYQRSDFEGWSWQRNNKSVFSGNAFRYDLQRLIQPMQKEIAKEAMIAYLTHLSTLPSIEYTFNFGNDTPDFMNEINWPTPSLAPNRAMYLVKQWQFQVEPMITMKVISQQQQSLLIAIGDAAGSAHPLAALGTIKFCRNTVLLPALLYSHAFLKELLSIENNSLVNTCLTDLEQLYHQQVMKSNQEVFWANVCCSLFSNKR